MTTELINSWTEHDEALRRLLPQLSRALRIFDEDLSRLNLERREIAESLRAFLLRSPRNTLKIILKDPDPFLRRSPRLVQLLRDYPERMTVSVCPQHLSSLSDSLLLIDDEHALVRFHQDNVRAKAIFADRDECIPYTLRFEEIAREGGEPLATTPLGL
jgi:hypothetical protein